MHERSDHRFQVDLRGLIDLLSKHLYSDPSVYLRELLQNGVDAIVARRGLEPRHAGQIQLELVIQDGAPPTLSFRDDGIGLTVDETHRFLATIGQSSKRGGVVSRPDDFLGRFGIGLLACFMVSDQIVLITRSARQPDTPGVEWRGQSDGTYSIRVLDGDVPVGTHVFLRGREDAAELLQPERVDSLARHFGEYLEPSIELLRNGSATTINVTPPWHEPAAEPDVLPSLLEFGRQTFERDFLDVIPLDSTAGKVCGLAFILAKPTYAGAKQRHRVYLKNMLLSTEAVDLLPDWAFFAQCIVNAESLRPTASRESFYDDDELEAAREELGVCLKRHLGRLARHEPTRLRQLIAVHHLPIKALAAEDVECLRLFADWLPFETSMGQMTLGEYRRKHPTIHYVSSCEQFRQVAQVAASESLPVINAGYVYDVQIIEGLGDAFEDVDAREFDIEELADRFESLSFDERDETVAFERLADTVLQSYKCRVEVAKFRPIELPALYVTNENADFLRGVDQSKEVADDLWNGILDGVSEEALADSYACLHLNYLNPMVRRVAALSSRRAQGKCVEMLYAQALLLGQFPLKAKEFRLLSEGLIGLIDWALSGIEEE